MADKPKSRALITPISKISYPHLHQPQPAQKPGDKPKYSCALIWTPEVLAIPKEKEKFDAIQAEALRLIKEKWGEKAQALLQSDSFKKGFRKDAEAKGYPKGSIYINVRTEQQPGIVYAHAGPDGKPAKMPVDKIREEMYAGALALASIVVFVFDRPDSKGVSFALNNMQKIGEGERLDGRAEASEEFDADLTQAPADLNSLIG